MKTKIKRHYRSAISILLTICMLISCMTVGLIATDAAKVTEDEVVGKSVSSVTFRVFTKNNSGSEQASATMTAANTEVNLTVPSSSTYYSVRVDVTYSDNSTANYYQDANNGSDYSIPEWGWYKTSRSGYFQYGAKFPSKNLKIYYQNLADSQVQVHVVKRPDNVNLTVNSVSNATATVTQGSAVATAGGSAVSMAAGSNATLDVAVTNNATHKVTAASYTSDGSMTSISLSNDGNGNYTGTFKVPTADTTVSVTVEERVFYTVTLTSPTNGTLTASKNSCEQGDEVVVTAEPEEGYRLASLTYTPADGSPIDIKSAKKFRMPGKNVTVTAEYVEKQTGDFTFEAKGTGSGVISAGKQYGGTTNMISETVTSPAAQAALPDGTKVNLCAIPDVGYIFEGWYEDEGCTDLLSTEKDVTVTVGEDPYTWYAKFTSASETGKTNVYFSEDIVKKNSEYNIYAWGDTGESTTATKIFGDWGANTNPKINTFPTVVLNGKTYYKMSITDTQLGSSNTKLGVIIKDASNSKLMDTKRVNKGGAYIFELNTAGNDCDGPNSPTDTTIYSRTYPVHLSISGTSYGDTGIVAYAQAGDQVAVIATSNDVSKAANVTCTDGSSGSVTVTNKRFTMPASEANVVVTYTDVETVVLTYNTVGVGTLTVRCNGKEIESGARIAKDSNVDFIAAPGTGYAFSSWSGSGDKPTGSAESVSKKITQNTNVIATFSQVSYKVVTSPNTNSPSAKDMKTLDNGYVRSVKKITTTDAWFTIKNEANSTYASSFKDGTDGSTHYAQKVSDSKPGYPYSWETTTPVKHVFRSGITGYVFYDPATGKIWMSDDPDGATGVTVIAKDGSFTDADGGADTNSQRYGKTTLKINGSADGVDNAYNNNAKKYTGLTADDVEEGTTEITVTTTVANSFKDAFKVVAFDVNGQTFYPEVSSGPSYTTTFKLSDITVNTAGYIEITPIYFLKDDSKTTRFYARNFSGDVKSRWGGTLYCYPFGMSSHSDEFTNWPGQPMINLGGGTYYVDVPSTTKAISLSNAAADWVHATTMGIVLDDSHSDTWVNRNHYQCQSYDYDDFRYIQELLTANGMSDEDIIFDFKFKEGKKKATGKDNFPALWNDNGNTGQTKYKDFPSTISASDMASNFSFWEDYTDFYGKNIDLWGNKITVNADVKNPVRVISQGYTDATTYSPNAGRYATAFIVYKPDDWYSDNPTYSLVPYTAENVYGVRSRSEFLQSLVVDGYSSSDMTAAKAALEHYPVKISYEYSLYECYATDGSQNMTNQYADRCDGVWYYSTSTTTVKAKIKIQYADKKTDKFTDDTFTDVDPAEYDYDGEVFKNNTGETTKASAYFIDKNYSGDYRDPDDENQIRPVDPPLNVSYSNRIKEWAYTDGYDKYDITATEPEDGVYSFIGWWKVSGNTEEFITSDYNYQMEVTNDETFIARYVKTPAGELKLLHNIHTSSEGTGDRLISYTVTKNGNEIPAKTGEVRATTEGETSSLRVPKDYIQYGKGYKITVTFTATPGTNVVNAGLYPTENGTDYLTKSNFETANSVTGFSLTTDSFSTTPTVKATNTETIEIDVDKLFYHGSDYEAGDADHKISLLQLFSAFENNPARSVTITKTTDASEDFSSYFWIKIYKNNDEYTTEINYKDHNNDDKTATYSTSGDLQGYMIHKGDVFTIPDLYDGDVIKVVEIDHKDAYYSFGSINVYDGSSVTDVESAYGKQFTVNGADASVEISNLKKKTTVVVKKLTNFDFEDGSTFDITIKSKPLGLTDIANNYTPNTTGKVYALETTTTPTTPAPSNGKYTIRATGYIVFEDVPLGTRFSIDEDATAGNSDVTGGQRFSWDYMCSVDNTTSPSTRENKSNGESFEVTSTVHDFEVHNKVYKRTIEISKNIAGLTEGDRLDTEFTIKVKALENGQTPLTKGEGASAITTNQYYTSFKYTSSDDPDTHTANVDPTTHEATITIKERETLTFQDIIVGSYFTVEEDGLSASDYSIPTLTVTNATKIGDSNNPINFTTLDTANDSPGHLQITNNPITTRTVTIKKVLPDFVSDIETGFSVHIQVSDTENGTYSDITGSFTSSISANNGTFTNGKVTIHNGETITFAVDKNKYFTVTEENVSSPYEFNALYLTSDTSTNLGNGYKCLADADKNFEIHNKVFANYTINYTYPSRFNNRTGEMLYDYQTYTVNGKIDSTDENFLNYIDYANSKVNQALVIAKNPFESDFMYNFVWDFDNTVYNPDSQEYTANVTTTTPTMQTVHVTFEFPYDYMDARGAGWTGTSIIYSASSANPARKTYDSPAAILIGYQTVPYALEPYQYFDEDGNTKTGYRIHCTTAPEKCGGKDFLYWSIREKAIGSDDTWVEVARCYTNEYTYATFNDYHVRPIFEGDVEADSTTEQTKSETTIKFLETSRNQWNNDQKGTKSTSYAGQDMVYADFDVAYRYKGQDVDDSTNLNIGVLIENIGTIEQEYLLDHRNTTTAEGKNAYTSSLAHYKDTTYYAYNEVAIKTYLRSVIKDGKSAADAQATYQTAIGEKPYTLNLKQRQPDQTLTNMNRVEYYHGSTVRSIASDATDKVNDWSVNEANTNGVFRAYSYIVDEEGNVTLSEPTYYTLYGTANLDHLTTE